MKIFINKTLISVFGGLIITTAVQAQDMPPGAIVSYIDCNFRAGVDMEETVRWGRNASRNDWAANQIFYRQPLVKPNGYEHDFRIARYYSSWSEYIERSEEIYTASLDSAPARQRPSVTRTDIMDCDPATRRIIRVRNVPGGAPPSDETLMTTRFCRLNEGRTLQDAWQRINHIASNWQSQGDDTLMQLTHRAIGPGNNDTVQGRQYVMTEVGETASSIAARWDMGREGFDARQGSEPVSECNYRALWRTYRIYQR
jgi:hypothetical protein